MAQTMQQVAGVLNGSWWRSQSDFTPYQDNFLFEGADACDREGFLEIASRQPGDAPDPPDYALRATLGFWIDGQGRMFATDHDYDEGGYGRDVAQVTLRPLEIDGQFAIALDSGITRGRILVFRQGPEGAPGMILLDPEDPSDPGKAQFFVKCPFG